MKWIVTGAGGMLGTDLVAALERRGHEVLALDSDSLDITDGGATADLPGADVIANCAAYTAVDAAEEDEATAFTVNAVGAQLLARAAAARGASLVHVSTDYVFGGDASEPYGEQDPLGPLSAYGRTKAAGEWAVRAEHPQHYIVRTAWLYGANGPCFPKTMARLATERDRLSVVSDQVGQPTWTRDLADLMIRLVEAEAPWGTYHGTSSGQVSWHGFTRAIVESMGRDPEMVEATTSDAFVRPAPRPAYSVLGHDALIATGVEPIGPWQERWLEAASSVLP
ncbi:MAG TPA: dTDP-4-dehydrorhamnose reductase [Actinomycetales bacterium]|nr:dTDP-4-dehydrorhamnose reductase [Actinomycetales bacterium]